jgi:N-acetylmuramoyl-L-alanine amidase
LTSTTTNAAAPGRPVRSTTTGAATTTTTVGDVVGPARRRRSGSLAGRVIGLDPGHNGRNYTDPTFIDHLIWNGREMEPCNTTGTETDTGYTEAQFNFNVATDLAGLLRAQGARVVMTRQTNSGVGPCVNVRARIIDRSHADVALDIHADGGPPGGRGVAILEPVADGPNDHIVAASEQFGHDVLDEMEMEMVAHMQPSTYDGTDGVDFRDDLAGLNLTTVPEILIESGNMRNATDAALLTSTPFQHHEALALDRAVRRFLAGRPRR